VNALAQQQVGQYLNRHFVSAFQKVATFQLVGGVQKQGGNVASYFCTPEGRVLHALAGPVDGGTFLREAKWANETFKLAQIGNPPLAEVQAFFRKAHTERLMTEHRIPLPKNGLPRPHAVSAKLLDQLQYLPPVYPPPDSPPYPPVSSPQKPKPPLIKPWDLRRCPFSSGGQNPYPRAPASQPRPDNFLRLPHNVPRFARQCPIDGTVPIYSSPRRQS